jgi:DinB family protein
VELDWTSQLADQLDWHWDNHLRPKLAGLTDEEYLWEPVAGCWSVRPRPAGDTRAPGSGAFTIDFAWPEPPGPPTTTIAWRLAHVIVGVFGMRAASHFAGAPISYDTFPYAGTAAQALEQLDTTYASWRQGVRTLSSAELASPCGPAEGPYSEYPMATLVLHINREALHHGAEILLLRDLYRNRSTLATT